MEERFCLSGVSTTLGIYQDYSTCVSNDLACWRSCAQPVPADVDIYSVV